MHRTEFLCPADDPRLQCGVAGGTLDRRLQILDVGDRVAIAAVGVTPGLAGRPPILLI